MEQKAKSYEKEMDGEVQTHILWGSNSEEASFCDWMTESHVEANL